VRQARPGPYSNHQRQQLQPQRLRDAQTNRGRRSIDEDDEPGAPRRERGIPVIVPSRCRARPRTTSWRARDIQRGTGTPRPARRSFFWASAENANQ
jgi:hypothetical protein